LPKWGCFRIFVVFAALVAGVNLFSAFFLKKIAFLPFVFYVWKEIYVMLFFQQLWSVIHTSTSMKRAKYLYGILFGVGGAGGAVGSLIPGFFAVKMGTENLLFFSFPLIAMLTFVYFYLLKNSEHQGFKEEEASNKGSGFKLLFSSKFLLCILMLVVFMQVAVTLIDFQFNNVLEKTVLQKDLRTEYTGRIFGLVNLCTIGLQFIGSFLLVQFLGMRLSHMLIPALLCLNAFSFLLLPVFGMISLSYITIKSFDFSVFQILKEMLYIPLKTEEKFKAKAIIDVFAYRTSKALASSCILLLQLFAGIEILTMLTWGTILLFLAWGVSIAFLFKKEDLTQRREDAKTQ
jgi:AAA family ATP:ADP antiporter